MACEPCGLISGTLGGRRPLAVRLPASSREPWGPCRNPCLTKTDERGRLPDCLDGHLQADLARGIAGERWGDQCASPRWARFTRRSGTTPKVRRSSRGHEVGSSGVSMACSRDYGCETCQLTRASMTNTPSGRKRRIGRRGNRRPLRKNGLVYNAAGRRSCRTTRESVNVFIRQT